MSNVNTEARENLINGLRAGNRYPAWLLLDRIEENNPELSLIECKHVIGSFCKDGTFVSEKMGKCWYFYFKVPAKAIVIHQEIINQ